METKEINITGMGCGSCVAKIEKDLLSQPGVSKAQVSLADHKLTLTFDQNQLALEQVIQRIETLGYQAQSL